MNQVEENIAQSIKHLKCFESHYADSWEKKKIYKKRRSNTHTHVNTDTDSKRPDLIP